MALPDLAVVTRAVVHEDSTVTLLARVLVDASNVLTAAVQSDFSTITYTVHAKDGTSVTAQTTLTISSTIYNSLQTGNIWSTTLDKDGFTGFNFKATVAASSFPTGATTYTVEVKFTLTGGGVFYGVFEPTTRQLQSS